MGVARSAECLPSPEEHQLLHIQRDHILGPRENPMATFEWGKRRIRGSGAVHIQSCVHDCSRETDSCTLCGAWPSDSVDRSSERMRSCYSPSQVHRRQLALTKLSITSAHEAQPNRLPRMAAPPAPGRLGGALLAAMPDGRGPLAPLGQAVLAPVDDIVGHGCARAVGRC